MQTGKVGYSAASAAPATPAALSVPAVPVNSAICTVLSTRKRENLTTALVHGDGRTDAREDEETVKRM